VATPKETIWEIEPHTIAKHKILEHYLKAWFPIVGRYNDTINYVDGLLGQVFIPKENPGPQSLHLKLPMNIQLNYMEN